jgi:hypothetical protein
MDETYIKAKGQWKYLYRAVGKQGEDRRLLPLAGVWPGSRLAPDVSPEKVFGVQ